MVTGGESGSTRFDKLDSTEIYKEFDGWQLVPESLPTLMSRFGLAKLNDKIAKPESKSPIPCPNRSQILTLRSDQV